MKKKLILLVVGFAHFIVTAQDSTKTFIDGIGIFKIKKTTTEVIGELENILNVKTVTTNSSSQLFRIKEDPRNSITELKEDSVNSFLGPTSASSFDKVRVFQVEGYIVAEIKLRDLILEFYNDTLFSVSCDYTRELIEAIHLKFGIGKNEKKEKEITCINKTTGKEYSVKEQAFYETWDYNGIHTIASLQELYNSKCERSIAGYFNVTHIKTFALVNEKEKEIEQLRKARRDADKRKKLDGL